MRSLAASWAIASCLLLAVLVTQIVIFRYFAPKDRFRFLRRALSTAWITAALTAYLLFPSLDDGNWSRAAVIVQAFAALFFLFLLALSFYTAVDGSLRTRMLVLLLRSDRGVNTRVGIMEAYGLSTLAERRIAKMRIGGMLASRGPGDVLTPKGRAMSAVFAAVKRFLRLGAGG